MQAILTIFNAINVEPGSSEIVLGNRSIRISCLCPVKAINPTKFLLYFDTIITKAKDIRN